MSFEIFLVVVYSVFLGNFITTLYYRIPNEIPIGPKHKPFCSNCKHPIKFRQYLPLFYYIFSDRHCKNCKTKVPSVYFKMECLTALMLILYYTVFNFGDEIFVSSSFLIPACSLLFFVALNYGKIHKDIIWFFAIACLSYRAFGLKDTFENTIVGLLLSYFLAKIIDGVSMKVKGIPIPDDAFRCIALCGLGLETAYTFILLIICLIFGFLATYSKRIVYAFGRKAIAVFPMIVYIGMFLPSHTKFKIHILSQPFLNFEIQKNN